MAGEGLKESNLLPIYSEFRSKVLKRLRLEVGASNQFVFDRSF